MVIQINPKVFNLPCTGLLLLLMLSSKRSRIYLITGLLEFLARLPIVPLLPLKISSRKGISMPTDTIEKTTDKMINKK